MKTNYGPDAPCQRTTGPCVNADPHLGGAHIDPRHPLYDGPGLTIETLPITARRAAQTLLRAGAPMPEVVDMAKEIHRLREQVAQVRVDKDRAVQAASERALDCTDHGKQIQRLEEQVHFFDRQADKNDAGRIALLGFLHQIRETVSGARQRERLSQPLPSTKDFIDVLEQAEKKASAAHDRAWSK